jgi:putative ABC transport system ATP-binding protein
VPTSSALTGRRLAEHPGFRGALDRENLTDDLVAMGARIAETMTEIFRDLPPGHPLFEQFSFIGAEELDEFEAILQRRASGGRAFRREDATRLLALPLAYIEPRHRLGLIEDGFRDRIVAARPRVRLMLEEAGDPGVDFYDADAVSTAAPLRDNLLFGRVNHNAADAQPRVTEAITAVIDELGLRDDVERVGLDIRSVPRDASCRRRSGRSRASSAASCAVPGSSFSTGRSPPSRKGARAS